MSIPGLPSPRCDVLSTATSCALLRPGPGSRPAGYRTRVTAVSEIKIIPN